MQARPTTLRQRVRHIYLIAATIACHPTFSGSCLAQDNPASGSAAGDVPIERIYWGAMKDMPIDGSGLTTINEAVAAMLGYELDLITAETDADLLKEVEGKTSRVVVAKIGKEAGKETFKVRILNASGAPTDRAISTEELTSLAPIDATTDLSTITPEDKPKIFAAATALAGHKSLVLSSGPSLLKFTLTPALFGHKINIPSADTAPEFFRQLFANKDKKNLELAYFFEPGHKMVWLFDPVLDAKRATYIPLRPAFLDSYKIAFKRSFRTNVADILKYDKDRSRLIIKAPEGVVEAAGRLADDMQKSAMREAMIFELKYANASDTPFSVARSGTITVQGIDDRLRRIFEFAKVTNGVPDSYDKPALYTDKELNNIIIVDHPEKRGRYQEVIDQLDTQPELVEITAAIIDLQVTSDFDWQSQFQVVAKERPNSAETYTAGFGANNDFTPAGGSLALPASALAAGTGLNAATMLIGSNYRIISKVKALEGEGKARIHSQPSILSINNHPARITDKTTAYSTRVGTRQAKFYGIESGLDLGVFPRIVESPEPDEQPSQPRLVHLIVDIGDGGVLANIDTESNRIITQAVLRDGQSLLIGGRYLDRQEDGSEHIPILGKIPVIGLPFKQKKVSSGKFQRLYLITPRILKPGDAAQRHNAIAEKYRRRAEQESGATAQAEKLALDAETTEPAAPSARSAPDLETDTDSHLSAAPTKERRRPIRNLLRRRR